MPPITIHFYYYYYDYYYHHHLYFRIERTVDKNLTALRNNQIFSFHFFLKILIHLHYEDALMHILHEISPGKYQFFNDCIKLHSSGAKTHQILKK